jgi:hypothetical protein
VAVCHASAVASLSLRDDVELARLSASPHARLAVEVGLRGSSFDEIELFRALERSGARALLIGRRALALLGLPVLTADYAFWLHIDDMQIFDEAPSPFDLLPTKTPEEARRTGRYRLENDELVDVLIARNAPTIDGVTVLFDHVWTRRLPLTLSAGVVRHIPCLDDLILTKRFGGRPKDAEDIRLLEALRGKVSA